MCMVATVLGSAGLEMNLGIYCSAPGTSKVPGVSELLNKLKYSFKEYRSDYADGR